MDVLGNGWWMVDDGPKDLRYLFCSRVGFNSGLFYGGILA